MLLIILSLFGIAHAASDGQVIAPVVARDGPPRRWIFASARERCSRLCHAAWDDMCIAHKKYLPFRALRESLTDGAFMYVLLAPGEFLLSKTDHLTRMHSCRQHQGATNSTAAVAQRLTHVCMVPDHRDLTGAGQLWVKKGKVFVIDNFSGHFFPPDSSLNEVDRVILSQGLSGLHPPLQVAWYHELEVRGVILNRALADDDPAKLEAVEELKRIDAVKRARAKLGGILASLRRNRTAALSSNGFGRRAVVGPKVGPGEAAAVS